MKKTKQVVVQVSEKMLKEFTKRCKDEEVTKSEVVRRCIKNFIYKRS